MDGVTFEGGANLSGARFHGDAYLARLQSRMMAFLRRAQFHGDAYLGSAGFHGVRTELSGAKFHMNTDLGGVHFQTVANLREAEFVRTPRVDGMRVKDRAGLPEGWTASIEPDADGLFEVLAATATPSSGDRQHNTSIPLPADQPS